MDAQFSVCAWLTGVSYPGSRHKFINFKGYLQHVYIPDDATYPLKLAINLGNSSIGTPLNAASQIELLSSPPAMETSVSNSAHPPLIRSIPWRPPGVGIRELRSPKIWDCNWDFPRVSQFRKRFLFLVLQWDPGSLCFMAPSGRIPQCAANMAMINSLI